MRAGGEGAQAARGGNPRLRRRLRHVARARRVAQRQPLGKPCALRRAPGAVQRHQIVQIGEHVAAVANAPRGQRGQFVPARAHRHVLDLQPRQQRGGVGDVAVVVGLRLAHLAVIKRQRRPGRAPIKVEQRQMPPDMAAKIVAMRPLPGCAHQQAHAVVGPGGHLIDMGDRVQPPGVVGRQRQPRAPARLRRVIGGGLLQREGVAACGVACVGMVAERIRHRLDRAAHSRRVAQHEADRVAQLHRQTVARPAQQQRVELVGGGGQPARKRGLQRRHKKPLTRVGPACVRRRLRAGQRGARRRHRLAPPEQKLEKAHRRVAHGEAGAGGQRRAQMLRRAGAMGEEGGDAGVPGVARGGVVQRHGVAAGVGHGHGSALPVSCDILRPQVGALGGWIAAGAAIVTAA